MECPSLYLEKIRKRGQIEKERLIEILDSHLIKKDTLETDNFESFLDERKEKLIGLIEKATGKLVQRTETQNT